MLSTDTKRVFPSNTLSCSFSLSLSLARGNRILSFPYFYFFMLFALSNVIINYTEGSNFLAAQTPKARNVHFDTYTYTFTEHRTARAMLWPFGGQNAREAPQKDERSRERRGVLLSGGADCWAGVEWLLCFFSSATLTILMTIRKILTSMFSSRINREISRRMLHYTFYGPSLAVELIIINSHSHLRRSRFTCFVCGASLSSRCFAGPFRFVILLPFLLLCFGIHRGYRTLCVEAPPSQRMR